MRISDWSSDVCSSDLEIVIRFDAEPPERRENVVEVAMPLGLYTSCSVSAPCGLCSTTGIIGIPDVPDIFLDPRRMQDRKSVVSGKSVSVRVDLGGRRVIKKKQDK